MTQEERFWAKVDKTDSCWLWTGHLSSSGYGRPYWNKRPKQAHRIAYELLVGPIPDGLELDHLCRNRTCVNPEHLEPVTTKENLLRGEGICAQNARKTHCKRGHELTPDNLFKVKASPNARGECRACNRERVRDRRAAQRAAGKPIR